MERAPQVIQAEPHLIIEVWRKNLLQLWTEDQCLLSEHGQRDTMLLVDQRDAMLLVDQRDNVLLVDQRDTMLLIDQRATMLLVDQRDTVLLVG